MREEPSISKLRIMTKLTTAEAYVAQVKADRRAAAMERRETEIAQDNNRVKDLYDKAEVKTPNLNLIAVEAAPAEIQEMVAEIAPLWKAQTGFDFPAILYYGSADCWGGGDATPSWWVAGEALPYALPAMFNRKGGLCMVHDKAKTGKYRFRTPALSTVLRRLQNGQPVFS